MFIPPLKFFYTPNFKFIEIALPCRGICCWPNIFLFYVTMLGIPVKKI